MKWIGQISTVPQKQDKINFIPSRLLSGHGKKWTILVTLTFQFWPGNGARHIITSLVVFVPHMKKIGQIGTGTWGGFRKKWTTSLILTFDISTWKWCSTHRPSDGDRLTKLSIQLLAAAKKIPSIWMTLSVMIPLKESVSSFDIS